MECYCYLRNVKDLLADRWPDVLRTSVPFTFEVDYSIWSRSKIQSYMTTRPRPSASVRHTSVLGIFTGYPWNADGRWTDDLLISGYGFHEKKCKSKETDIQKRDNDFFYIGRAKYCKKDSRYPPL